jgi:hypothetical protein
VAVGLISIVSRRLEQLGQLITSQLGVAEDLAQQTRTDDFPRVDRYDLGSPVLVSEEVMTPLDAQNLETGAPGRHVGPLDKQAFSWEGCGATTPEPEDSLEHMPSSASLAYTAVRPPRGYVLG